MTTTEDRAVASAFVRYAPDVETIDPDIDALVAQSVAFWEQRARESVRVEGAGHAVRGAHAKSFGLVKADVEILAEVPAAYAQGIYAVPGRHGALIRFSSTSSHLGPDAKLGPGLGLAIKIFDVPGEKLVEGEPDATTFDLVLKNNPVFISNTVRHYLFVEDILNNAQDYVAQGRAGLHRLLADVLTGKGELAQADWAWDEVFAILRLATQTPVRNPLLSTFWTMGAVRHGDHVAKVRLAPAADSATRVIHRELSLTTGPEVFGPTLVDELQAGPFDFDLQVQLCTDLATMPVDRPTVEWPEAQSPFVTVARVRLPCQDISGPENAEKSEALAFNQWRVTAEHRPLGEIMAVRRIYAASARVRRTINHQSQVEPASADSVLP